MNEDTFSGSSDYFPIDEEKLNQPLEDFTAEWYHNLETGYISDFRITKGVARYPMHQSWWKRLLNKVFPPKWKTYRFYPYLKK